MLTMHGRETKTGAIKNRRAGTLGRQFSVVLSILVLLLSAVVVDAVFTPANRAELKIAVGTCPSNGACSGGCLGETPDGSCPIFAATNGNGVIGDWLISKVNSLDDMFQYATAFNADISQWQTGAVTTMKYSEYTNHSVVTVVECSQVFSCYSFFFFLLFVLFLHLCFSCGCFLV